MLFMLSVESLTELEEADPFWQQNMKRLDPTRQKYFEQRKKRPQSRAVAMGAGLLLQYGFSKYLEELQKVSKEKQNASSELWTVSLQEVLDTEQTLPLSYVFGKDGKPLLEKTSWDCICKDFLGTYAKESCETFENPPFFNLSHAGNLVVLGISQKEIGLDVQDFRSSEVHRLAERFFHPQEVEALLQEKLFYKLWSRKEALGKCTGSGVTPVLSQNLYWESGKVEPQILQDFTWQEWETDDAVICLCGRK